MKKEVAIYMNDLDCSSNRKRKIAFDSLFHLVEKEVDFIYEIWDELVKKLDSRKMEQRLMGMYLLTNLSKSDYENRFNDIIEKYLGMMEDKKFVVAIKTIQNCWIVAINKRDLTDTIIQYLFKMFDTNVYLDEHSFIIRRDVVYVLSKINKYVPNKVDLDLLKRKINSVDDEMEKTMLNKILIE